jgi:hypothetical protein
MISSAELHEVTGASIDLRAPTGEGFVIANDTEEAGLNHSRPAQF